MMFPWFMFAMIVAESGILAHPFIQGLLAAAAVVVASGTLWTRALRPLVHASTALAQLAQPTSEEDPTPIIITSTRGIADDAKGAHLRASEALTFARQHDARDRACFEAIASWTENFNQFDPLDLPPWEEIEAVKGAT